MEITFQVPFMNPASLLDMSDRALEIARGFDGKSASHYVAWLNLSNALGDKAEQMLKEEGK